jgi:hypothetical protein
LFVFKALKRRKVNVLNWYVCNQRLTNTSPKLHEKASFGVGWLRLKRVFTGLCARLVALVPGIVWLYAGNFITLHPETIV